MCGLTRPEDVLLARELGADFAGFVFAKSPRRVGVEKAAALRALLDGSATRAVGVFAGETPEPIAEIVRAVRLDLAQVHGGVPAEGIGVPVIRALRVRGDRIEGDAAGEAPAWYLLDAYAPRAAGGTGHSFDWGAAARLRPPRPFLLAGGLTAENVGCAIRALAPDGVDVSTGIEEAPGRKSETKMREFVAAARAAFLETEKA